MHRYAIFALCLSLVGCCARLPMQDIRVAPDQKEFHFAETRERFVPWGQNYGLELMAEPNWNWKKVDGDMRDLQTIGTNVLRVHLQFPQFMKSPGVPNPHGFHQLQRLLKICERHDMYLDITGLACYRPADRAAWYDALDTEHRWQVQAKFWKAIAHICCSSPAVFCYDLMNEPIITGKRSDGWYAGRLGGYDFLQRISLDEPANTNFEDLSRAWVHTLVTAIRSEDQTHLITVGELNMWGLPPKAIAPELDFMAVHLYPQTGKVQAAIDNLKIFAVGKPLVIEETFPLSCSVTDERQFILESRGVACGWIGQYSTQTPAELRALRDSGKIKLIQSAYLDWIDLFEELGLVMKHRD